MLEHSGGLPLGATLESAEAPRAPARGGAAAEAYTPPLVDGERWPRPAPRGVSERVAAPVMSALVHAVLVAGLLLAAPIGPPIETPEPSKSWRCRRRARRPQHRPNRPRHRPGRPPPMRLRSCTC